MENPWQNIKLSDYENHMKLDTVMQLQAMNAMMKGQFYDYPVKTIMILGVAGGNGLEHIWPQHFEKVYGVDINREYLRECAARYKNLAGTLECVHADLMDDAAVLPHADLVVANLLVEYIGYHGFQKTIAQIWPQYVSCIIQINTDDSFVSDSPYLHVFDGLDRVHHPIDENGLSKAMEESGYLFTAKAGKTLPNGKKLMRMDFRRRDEAQDR